MKVGNLTTTKCRFPNFEFLKSQLLNFPIFQLLQFPLLHRPPAQAWPLHHINLPVRSALEGGSVETNQLSSPPHPGGTLFRQGREPVLPQYGANLAWSLATKRTACEQRQHVFVVLEQAH